MSVNFVLKRKLSCDTRILELNGAEVTVQLTGEDIDKIVIMASRAMANDIHTVVMPDYSPDWRDAVTAYGVRYSNLLNRDTCSIAKVVKQRRIFISADGSVYWSSTIADTQVITAKVSVNKLQVDFKAFTEAALAKETWIKEVNNGNTLLGYQEWVADRKK